MKYINLLPGLLLILINGSCATLNVTDIRSIEPTRFESIKLDPDLEANELRVDLIRKSESVQVNDSTSEQQDTPYHPMGFDLGNWMFYDLNGNLSFRLDELLGVRGRDCWSAMETNRRIQLRPDRIYSFCDNYLTVQYPPGRRQREVNQQVTEGNTTSVRFRNRQIYSVEFNDNEILYRSRRRIHEILHKDREGQYYLRNGWWREYFRHDGDRIFLGRDYIIEQSNDNRTIRIKRPGWRNRILCTIEKSPTCIYVYDKRFRGKQIEFTDEGISVYRNRRFMTGWKLLN